MKVSFFQYQNGLNNGDVINGCGLFRIINFCNFVLKLLLANNICQVLQRHIKLQSGAKKSHRGAGITKWGITTLSERKDTRTFKCSYWKTLLPQWICYWYNLLRRMFFISYDNWKPSFFIKVIVVLWLF